MTVTSRLIGVPGFVSIKDPCIVASTTNLVLSSSQVIDGVAVSTGDRVLAKDQTDTTENGIYVVNSGNWTRSADFNGKRDAMQGTLVLVLSGSSFLAPVLYYVSSTGINTPGSSTITFTQLSTASS